MFNICFSLYSVFIAIRLLRNCDGPINCLWGIVVLILRLCALTCAADIRCRLPFHVRVYALRRCDPTRCVALIVPPSLWIRAYARSVPTTT